MTALSPAQVRDHARALIRDAVEDVAQDTMGIAEYLGDALDPDDGDATDDLTAEEADAQIAAVADAIRTARITVDWDEETA